MMGMVGGAPEPLPLMLMMIVMPIMIVFFFLFGRVSRCTIGKT
jgi:hypothetical protein